MNLSTYIAGSYAPTLLADLGAEVIKIESADGDPLRPVGLAFTAYNRGQRCMVLDLKQPEAREMVLGLVRDADVVVENYRAGTAARLGLDYRALAAINPRIVYLSATGYGPSGPRAGETAFDVLLQAEAGLMRAQGGDDGEPVLLGPAVNDFTGAILGATGIMMALFERERSDAGQHVHTSLLGAALAIQAGDLVVSERVAPANRGGRDLRGLSPLYRFYEAADGWLFVDARNAERCASLFAAVGPAGGTPEYAVAVGEPAEGALGGRLAAAFRHGAVAGWLERLHATGVVAVPVLTAGEALGSEQAVANGLCHTAEHPLFGSMDIPFASPRFSAMPSHPLRSSPIAAEHTVEILRERGLDQVQIDAFLVRRIAVQGSLEQERRNAGMA